MARSRFYAVHKQTVKRVGGAIVVLFVSENADYPSLQCCSFRTSIDTVAGDDRLYGAVVSICFS